ncbi:hypothetical protein FRC03_005613 [Tulasnella sp. 419]|nr:hypothetical protein FRC03_005613 [Tulasnella sp. 419]
MRSDWGKTIDPDKKIHTDAVYCVAFSPDGNEVAYGGEDGTVTVWNIGRHAMIHSLKGHKRAVLTVAFSTDGKHLASGSHHEIVVWNVEDGGTIKTLHPRGYVQNVGFSCDGVYLVASHEPTLTVISRNSRRYSKWRTKDLKQCKPLSFKSKEVVKVLKGSPYIGAPPSGTYLAKAEDSQWVEKRSQGITVERLCHLPHHDITASASFGRYFAFGTRRGTIYVLDFPPELFGITSTATAMNWDQQLLFGPDSDAVDSALESDSDSMVPAFGSESDSD